MDKTLAEIKKQVFARRPVLKQILETHGGEFLKEYIAGGWQVEKGILDNGFAKVLGEEITQIHGPEPAKTVLAQLAKKPLVSTIDHLGVCSHPFFVNSDVIYSLAFKQNEIALVLATESVSLNNTSSRSASLLYHEGQNLEYSSFLPDRLKNLPVFSSPAITQKDIRRLSLAIGGRFDALIAGLELEKSSAANLSVQAAQTSFKFWQKIFPSAPKMLYVPLETLVSKYLLKALENSDNFFHHLLLTKAGQGLWRKYFADDHTFMFWGIDEKGKRQALLSLPEKTDGVLALLRERKIYPSSPLCFVVLLNAGLTCAGGFTQTSWLKEVKEKLLAMMAEAGNASAEKIKNIGTDNFAESSLAWLKSGDGYIAPSAVDLYLSGQDYYPKYQLLSEKLTLAQSLDLAMPDIYRVVVPKAEQIAENGLKMGKEAALTFLAKVL